MPVTGEPRNELNPDKRDASLLILSNQETSERTPLMALMWLYSDKMTQLPEM